jgi:hypothetical protein
MHKFGKVAITAIITGILALGVAAGVAGLTGKGLAATCGNSDDCAKTLAPGDPTSPSPGGHSTTQIAPGTQAQTSGLPAKDFAPGQEKS